MVKPRLDLLPLKVTLSVFMSLIILALLASCAGQPVPMPAVPPPAPTETPPTPTETPPAPSESEELPGAELFMAPELPPPSEAPAYSPSPAFDCFLEIEGIPGESTDDRHTEWIDVLSYSWGVSQPGSGLVSSGSTRSAERADYMDFSVVKTIDKTSPKLALYCSSGTHLDEVTLELCRAEEDKQRIMAYKMEDVIVSSVRPSGPTQGGEALPLEEVSFSYGKITWTYTEVDHKTGKPKGDVEAYWDLEANKGG